MALSRTLLRTYADDFPENPERTLQAVNQRVLVDVDAGQFVTVFYGILDPAKGVLTYCNAGHNPPLLLNLNGQNEPAPLSRTGMALGVSDEAEWTSRSARIEVGDLLLLYTDGLVDAQEPEGEPFGIQRGVQILQANAASTAGEVQDALLNAVFAFMDDEPQFDDITLVLVKRTA